MARVASQRSYLANEPAICWPLRDIALELTVGGQCEGATNSFALRSQAEVNEYKKYLWVMAGPFSPNFHLFQTLVE